MAGVPSAVIRFACHLPLGIVGVNSLSNWNDIKTHDILHHPPYNKFIFPAWHLAGGMGIFAFSWNFAMWIPTAIASGPILTFFGMVDFVIALSLTVAAALEAKYLPHAKSSCTPFIQAHPKNSTAPSLFIVIAEKNATFSDYRDNCESYVDVWSCMIAVSILYFFSAFFNIVLGVISTSSRQWSYNHSSYGTTHQPHRRKRSKCFSILYYTTCFPPYFVLWKVPSWSILKIRFFKKYAGKFWRGRKEQARDTELFTITEKQKAQSKNVDIFVDLLSEGRIVEALASNLHFMDMFNLSSTCRAIREALGSSAKELEPYENLRVMSCDDGSKITCWTCKSQICCGCQTQQANATSRTRSHMKHCIVYCSKCYFDTKLHRPSSRYGSRRGPCLCYKSEGWRLPNEYPDQTNADTPQFICRNCALLTGQQLEAKREQIAKAEMLFLARQVNTCGKCSTRLGVRGPRWWVCTLCDKECSDGMHLQWMRKRDKH